MAERALVVVPTYNEAANLPLIVPQILAQNLRIDVLVVDDNSPDGTGQMADEMAAGRAADPRPASPREGRPRKGVPRRVPLGAGARLRVHLRDGRRLQPRPQIPEPVPGRGQGCRPGDRLALQDRRERHQLADLPAPAVARRQPVRPVGHRAADRGLDRRLQVLSPEGARGDRPRPGALQRLLVPDRDELPRLEEGLSPGRDSHRVHRSDRGAEQDEQADRAGGHLDGVVAAL